MALSKRDHGQEQHDVHNVIRSVQIAQAEGGSGATHPEVVRFSTRSEGVGLLVARIDFLRASIPLRPEGTAVRVGAHQYGDLRLWVTEEFDDWEAFRVAVNWPMLVAGRPATPWAAQGVTYEAYRAEAGESPWQPPDIPHESQFGYGSDKEGTAEPGPWEWTDEELGLTEPDSDAGSR